MQKEDDGRFDPLKNIYLTFDLDWASDEVLDFFYNVIDDMDISYTMNVTHATRWLEVFRGDRRIELGLHPNFNFLLENRTDNGSDKEKVFKRIQKIVPEAVTVRSHSLVNSTPMTELFSRGGVKYELNYFIPPVENSCLMPWNFQNVLQIPFIYEDDLYLLEKEQKRPSYYLGDSFQMLRVFNFHPIHLFLNTINLEQYQEAKKWNKDFNRLKEFRNNASDAGTFAFFRELVDEAKMRGYHFVPIKSLKNNGGIRK